MANRYDELETWNVFGCPNRTVDDIFGVSVCRHPWSILGKTCFKCEN